VTTEGVDSAELWKQPPQAFATEECDSPATPDRIARVASAIRLIEDLIKERKT
jgi:hypothetical protein